MADKATSDITAIRQTQAGQATSIDRLDAKFDNLAVGGRNLLKNSSPNIANTDYRHRFELAVAPNVGDDVIVTLWGEMGADRTGIGVYNTQGYNQLLSLTKIADGVYQGHGTWKLPMNGNTPRTPNNTHLNVYFFPNSGKSVNRIDKIKLERGTIPTDWTPAPEDVQSQLDEKASTATLDEFKQAQATKDQATASRITALDTAYKQADTQANAKIDSEITARTSGDNALSSRIDSLRSEFNGNKASIDAQLRTLSEKDKAQAQQLSQMGASLGQKADAAAINELTARVQNVDGKITAETKKTETLQATVGRHTASIQQHAQVLDGIKSEYSIKLDINGHVVGLVL